MRRIAPEVSAAALLDSATRRGRRRRSGFGRDYGTLAAGKRAALVAVRRSGRDARCGRISGQRRAGGRDSPRRLTATALMLSRIRTYGSFVRFSHSVFALPFALVGGLLAMRAGRASTGRACSGLPRCMVTARSAAMGFNRVVDARFDARNPRTATRELPAGRMTPREAWMFVVRRVRGVRGVRRAARVGRAWRCRRSRSRSCSGTRWPSA